MNKLLAFDIEIGTIIPEGTADWDPYRPFDISCAVTLESDTNHFTTFHEWDFAAGMDIHNVQHLVNFLRDKVSDGYTIVTFNGCGFDFRCLFESSKMFDECKELALNHVDIFFQLFCQLGYAPGLDRLCKGMNLGEKPEGVNGAAAPQMWLDGRYQEVLDYCAGDVRLTMALALEAKRLGAVRWTSRAGKSTGARMLELLTVRESLLLPEPDVSWQTGERWTREKFTGWMK